MFFSSITQKLPTLQTRGQQTSASAVSFFLYAVKFPLWQAEMREVVADVQVYVASLAAPVTAVQHASA
jgi:hypothetical protein